MAEFIPRLKKLIEQYTSQGYTIEDTRMKDGIDRRVVVYSDPRSYISEQYRVLRTNLYSLSPQKPLHTVTVTSAQRGDGKTLTSCNLAMSLSLDLEKTTILVDCDLRRPGVHKLFNLSRRPGLTNILRGEADIKLFTEKPAVGNLYIIPSGSIISNPSEVLQTHRIKDFISELRKRFDFIIFDTPPVISVTDASIIGSQCDGLLLVIKAGATQRDVVDEAVYLLKEAQVPPAAAILVNVSIPMHYYYLYGYKYQYKYRYGYGTGEANK